MILEPDDPRTQQELAAAEPPAPHRSESDQARVVNAARLLLEWLLEEASQPSGENDTEERASKTGGPT